LCAIAAATLPSLARAEEGPYSNFLVGERSMGLGGAFVAVADDVSALFHNPSGLASLSTSAYSGGLWAFFEGRRTIENGYRTELGSVSLEHSATLALPSFLGGVVKFGSKQADGVRPHALGAALMSPFVNEYRFVGQLNEASTAVDRIEVRHADSARWLGLSYAYRLRPGLAFGITVFGAQRGVTHDEVELLGREPTTEVPDGANIARASTVDVDAYQLIVRLGAHVDLARELRAGLMFQPPGLDIGGSAAAEYAKTTTGEPSPMTEIDLTRNDDAGYNLPTPWELRFGLGYLAHGGELISIDFSFFGPAGSKSDPLPLIDDDEINYGLFVPRETYRRPALRGALGFEAELTEVTPMRGGIFFERSSAAEVLSTAPRYVRDRVDRVGVALSIGIRTAGYDFAIGSSATLGTGEALAPTRTGSADDPSGVFSPPSYVATDVRDMRLMVFIGGGNHAVRQLVKSVFD
jgi:long-chain fatty acid transport protein